MADLRERVLYPKAGWLSLGLLLVMALALTWAVQGAEWLDQLEFLPPVALWALVAGAILGVLPISVVWSLSLGAVAGAAVVLWAIGGEYHTALDQAGRIEALRDDLVSWTVTVLRTGYPAELSPYAIGLGALMWSTALHGRVRGLSPQPGARRHRAPRRRDDRQPVGHVHQPARPSHPVRGRGTPALAARRARRPAGRLAAPPREREPGGARRDPALGHRLRRCERRPRLRPDQRRGGLPADERLAGLRRQSGPPSATSSRATFGGLTNPAVAHHRQQLRVQLHGLRELDQQRRAGR